MRRLRQKTNKKKHSKVNCDKKSCVYPKKEINLTDKSVIKYFKSVFRILSSVLLVQLNILMSMEKAMLQIL